MGVGRFLKIMILNSQPLNRNVCGSSFEKRGEVLQGEGASGSLQSATEIRKKVFPSEVILSFHAQHV